MIDFRMMMILMAFAVGQGLENMAIDFRMMPENRKVQESSAYPDAGYKHQ